MMKWMKTAVMTFAAASMLFTFAPQWADAAQVKVAQGVLQSADTDDQGIVAFKGIPYAQPPVGNLRWMPPQAAQSWDGVRDAKEYGNQSAQNEDLGVFAAAGGSEDCLYLNVFYDEKAVEEAKAKGEKLPVFVWIHGGALYVGAGSDYNPTKLAKEGKAIVVTFNYRLGLLGAFAHPAIDAENHAKVNYGLMDQTAALQWVHDNIEAFGGDSNNVTISGESSGGNSVHWHLVNPHANGLYQQAISMSGSCPIWSSPRRNITVEEAEQFGIGFAKAVGLDNATAEQLRSLTTRQILDAQGPYLMSSAYVIDNDYVPDHVAKLLKEGKINNFRVFVNGNVHDEGRFFAGLREYYKGKPMDKEDYLQAIKEHAADLKSDPYLPEKIMQEYPVENYGSYAEAFAAVVTDTYFHAPATSVNRWVSQYMPVYAYEFADETAPGYLGSSLDEKAAHTYEIPYLFPGFHGTSKLVPQLNAKQEKLSKEMVQYWTHADKLPQQDQWKPFDNEHTNNYYRLALGKSHMLDEDKENNDLNHHRSFWLGVGMEYEH